MTSQDRSSTSFFRGALKCLSARLPAVAACAALAGVVMSDGVSSASPLPATAGVATLRAFAGAGTPNSSPALSAAEGGTPIGQNAGSGGDPNPTMTTAPCPILSSPEIRGGQRRLTPSDARKNDPCGPAATPPIALPSPGIEHAPPLQPPPAAPQAEQQQVILKGLRLVDSAAKIQLNGVQENGIVIENLSILETPSFRSKLQTFLGHPVSQEMLQTVGTAISDWYRDHDYPFVDVAFPAGQDVTNGTVQLVVTESRTGNILAQGNRWFASSLLTDQVRLAPGDRISLRELESDKDWLNQNPFRVVNIVAQKSAVPGYTDFTVETIHEEFPLHVHAGYNNDGVPVIGRDQWSYGLDWGNAFWLDHQFSYTFTASKPLWSLSGSSPVSFQEHSASYSIPLPWHDKLVLFGTYAQSAPQLGPDLGLTGVNYQLSGRYVHLLPSTGLFTQQIQFGFDFKSSNNNLEFGGTQVLNVTTFIDQFLITYDGTLKDNLGQTTIENNFVSSPGNLSGHNSDQDFAAQSPFATARYTYDNLSITRLTGLPQDSAWVNQLGWFKGVSSLTRLVAQISTTNLLPSEQLGIGGTDTVPGYDERTANGSQGVLVSEELLLPAFSLAQQLDSDLQDQIQLSAFWAYGDVRDVKTLAGTPAPPDIESVGLGLRFAFGRYVNLHANYGWQLRKLPGAVDHGEFGHVALTLTY
jgi:hemolysin activation/secretion protein